MEKKSTKEKKWTKNLNYLDKAAKPKTFVYETCARLVEHIFVQTGQLGTLLSRQTAPQKSLGFVSRELGQNDHFPMAGLVCQDRQPQ